MKENYDVVVVGGGLAGLTCALHLAKQQLSVCVIEKQSYPSHKVCGEYVSNEIVEYLKSLNINPMELGAKAITHLWITSETRQQTRAQLPLGGFGISRYAFDAALAEEVRRFCPIFIDQVTNISFQDNAFFIATKKEKKIKAKFVIGAYGKRSLLDKKLHRNFFQKKTPWMAVKAHYKASFPDDMVTLHHFRGGYCGLSKVETNAVNACYLTKIESFKKYKSIAAFEKEVMYKNPFLETFFTTATPLFDSPLSISQISFQKKLPVENHIFMIGDSAGLIHPLCGNGMAMAIHSAKISAELLIDYFKNNKITRKTLENRYTQQWNTTFQRRLQQGFWLQKIFMQHNLFGWALETFGRNEKLVQYVIKQTHGKPVTP